MVCCFIKVDNIYFSCTLGRCDDIMSALPVMVMLYQMKFCALNDRLTVHLLCPITPRLIHPSMNCMIIPLFVGGFLSWVLFLWAWQYWGWFCRVCQRRYLCCWRAIRGQKAHGGFMAGLCVIRFLARCLATGNKDVPCLVLPNIWHGVWWVYLVRFYFINCLPISYG